MELQTELLICIIVSVCLGWWLVWAGSGWLPIGTGVALVAFGFFALAGVL